MSKLHEIFLKKNPDFNHGQAIKELIQQENLDINAKDEDGNTILHLMSIHIYRNYHNPYLEKSNPEGKFIHSTGHDGYFCWTNYKGPDFLDDLELLLALGANPNLKNNQNETAINLFFTEASNFILFTHISKYFELIQQYHPDAFSMIEVLQHAAFRSSPKFRDECLAKRLPFFCTSWIEIELIKVLDERLLPLDCLQLLVKWIDQEKLKELEASDEMIAQIRQRLISQIDCQIVYPFILDGVEQLAQFYLTHKDILLRGMLINDPRCPLFSLIDQLNHLNREQLLTKDLNELFDRILNDYNKKREICEELKAVPQSLDENECFMLKRISESLDSALNGKAYREVHQSFNEKTDYSESNNFMVLRWSLFQEYRQQSLAVKNELEQHFRRNSL